MAVSTQFQLSVKKALKNKSARLIKKIEKKTAENADEILELLRRQTSYGGKYIYGDGIGIKNTVETSKDNMSKWRKYRREAKSTISYVFRNDAPYAAGLYGYDEKYWNHPKKQSEKRARNHPDGFRSGANHVDDRPEQVSKAKWLRFRHYVKDALIKKIDSAKGI